MNFRNPGLSVGLSFLLLVGGSGTAEAANPVWLKDKTDTRYEITVYRSANCGCCKGWIDHLRDHNFAVDDRVTEDMGAVKERLGVPPQGASCHTAVVDGKVIEGHVPAQDIKALLGADSDIRLLTVPGMPSGGPGMDFEGARKDPFRVYALDRQNRVSVFREYRQY